MSLLRPGPLDVTAGSTFSFDELLGLVVDSMQIYGNEITKLRRANEDFKDMLKTLESNLVGEMEEEIEGSTSRPVTPATINRTKQVESYVAHAARLAQKMYRPVINLREEDSLEAAEGANFKAEFNAKLKSPLPTPKALARSWSSGDATSTSHESKDQDSTDGSTVANKSEVDHLVLPTSPMSPAVPSSESADNAGAGAGRETKAGPEETVSNVPRQNEEENDEIPDVATTAAAAAATAAAKAVAKEVAVAAAQVEAEKLKKLQLGLDGMQEEMRMLRQESIRDSENLHRLSSRISGDVDGIHQRIEDLKTELAAKDEAEADEIARLNSEMGDLLALRSEINSQEVESKEDYEEVSEEKKVEEGNNDEINTQVETSISSSPRREIDAAGAALANEKEERERKERKESQDKVRAVEKVAAEATAAAEAAKIEASAAEEELKNLRAELEKTQVAMQKRGDQQEANQQEVLQQVAEMQKAFTAAQTKVTELQNEQARQQNRFEEAQKHLQDQSQGGARVSEAGESGALAAVTAVAVVAQEGQFRQEEQRDDNVARLITSSTVGAVQAKGLKRTISIATNDESSNMEEAKDKVKELPRVTNISSAGRPKTPKKTGGKALLFARVAQQVVQEVRAKRESILKKANTHPGGSFADRLEALEEKLSEVGLHRVQADRKEISENLEGLRKAVVNLESGLAENQAHLVQRETEWSAELEEIKARVTALEEAQAENGVASADSEGLQKTIEKLKTEVQGALANATEQLAEVTGEIIPDITNRMSTLETTTFDMSESNTAANSATATRVKDLVDRLEAMQAELEGDSKQAETLRSVAAQVAELFELSSLTSDNVSSKADTARMEDLRQQLLDYMDSSQSQLARLESVSGGEDETLEHKLRALKEEMMHHLAREIEESLERERTVEKSNPNDPSKALLRGFSFQQACLSCNQQLPRLKPAYKRPLSSVRSVDGDLGAALPTQIRSGTQEHRIVVEPSALSSSDSIGAFSNGTGSLDGSMTIYTRAGNNSMDAAENGSLLDPIRDPIGAPDVLGGGFRLVPPSTPPPKLKPPPLSSSSSSSSSFSSSSSSSSLQSRASEARRQKVGRNSGRPQPFDNIPMGGGAGAGSGRVAKGGRMRSLRIVPDSIRPDPISGNPIAKLHEMDQHREENSGTRIELQPNERSKLQPWERLA